MVLRKENCTHEDIGTDYVSTHGNGTVRRHLVVPKEQYHRAVVCLSRAGGAYVQVGAAFAVGSIEYSLSSEVGAGVQITVVLSGMSLIPVPRSAGPVA